MTPLKSDANIEWSVMAGIVPNSGIALARQRGMNAPLHALQATPPLSARLGPHLVDTTMFWSATGGGVARYLRDKRRFALRDAGWRHTWVVPGECEEPGRRIGGIPLPCERRLPLSAAAAAPCTPARCARAGRDRGRRSILPRVVGPRCGCRLWQRGRGLLPFEHDRRSAALARPAGAPCGARLSARSAAPLRSGDGGEPLDGRRDARPRARQRRPPAPRRRPRALQSVAPQRSVAPRSRPRGRRNRPRLRPADLRRKRTCRCSSTWWTCSASLMYSLRKVPDRVRHAERACGFCPIPPTRAAWRSHSPTPTCSFMPERARPSGLRRSRRWRAARPPCCRPRAGFMDLIDGRAALGVSNASAGGLAEGVRSLRDQPRQALRELALKAAGAFDQRRTFARQFERYAALTRLRQQPARFGELRRA